MNIRQHHVLRDYVSRHDRLNPRHKSPREHRREDNLRILWQATVAFGLWVIAVDLVIKLISGDLT